MYILLVPFVFAAILLFLGIGIIQKTRKPALTLLGVLLVLFSIIGTIAYTNFIFD
jgi:hypothetical protein